MIILDLFIEKHSRSISSRYAFLVLIFFNLAYKPIEKPPAPQREQQYLLLFVFRLKVPIFEFLLYPQNGHIALISGPLVLTISKDK